MSDERLRDLERRWKETGSVEDEAAWLKERVRIGELTQERLELADRLGDPTARHLAARGEDPLELAAADLSPLTRRECVAWAADCAEHALLALEKAHAEQLLRTAIDAARYWATCPGGPQRIAAESAAESLRELEAPEGEGRWARTAALDAKHACLLAADAVAYDHEHTRVSSSMAATTAAESVRNGTRAALEAGGKSREASREASEVRLLQERDWQFRRLCAYLLRADTTEITG